MKKELAIALPLALGVPFAAAASCSITSPSSSGAKTTTCTAGTDLTNISNDIDIQASSGVLLTAEDGTVSGGSFTTGSSGGAIGVSSCHTGGSAYFYGHTDGGSVLKNTNNFSCSSGNAVTYSTASS